MLTYGFRYWSRRFQKHMRQKQAGRMTGIPEIMVPDIFVDDDNIDELTDDGKARSSGLATPASHLSVDFGGSNRGSGGSVGSRGSRSSSPARDMSWFLTEDSHPLNAPRHSSSSQAAPTSPHATTSALSFELFDPEGGQGSAAGEMRRRGSATSPTQARGILEGSVWADTMRSPTVRRSGRGRKSQRFTNLS